MEIDHEKIDNMVLALLHLTSFDYRGGIRTWKGYDWDSLNRLYEKGMISDPRTKAKSVLLTDEGSKRSGELFREYFEKEGRQGTSA
jgi:hypothetical protein